MFSCALSVIGANRIPQAGRQVRRDPPHAKGWQNAKSWGKVQSQLMTRIWPKDGIMAQDIGGVFDLTSSIILPLLPCLMCILPSASSSSTSEPSDFFCLVLWLPPQRDCRAPPGGFVLCDLRVLDGRRRVEAVSHNHPSPPFPSMLADSP